MPDNISYEYAIIRVVPVVEREEFINIGVIVYAKRKKFLGMKYHIDAKRLAAFGKNIDLALITNYLKAWDLVCQGDKVGGEIGGLEMHVRFRWLTANRSSIIQSSATHPGLCVDPTLVLADIFERYVL
ncbi:MAG: DUF3037 domain-containing protein [Saprospiraceae bacterium]